MDEETKTGESLEKEARTIEVTLDHDDANNYDALLKASANIREAAQVVAEAKRTKAEADEMRDKLKKDLDEAEKQVRRKIRFDSGPAEKLSEFQGKSFEEIITARTDHGLVKEVQNANDDLILLRAMADSLGAKGPIQELCPKSFRRWNALSSELKRQLKSTADPLTTTDTGEGADWVPTILSAELLDGLYRMALRVPGLFREIPMPAKIYQLPIQTGKSTATAEAETQSTPADLYEQTATNITTSKVTLTAVKSRVLVHSTGEFIEDSIIPALPILRQEIVTALAEGEENAIINGQGTVTTNSANGDEDVTTSTDIRKLYTIGLRFFALDSSATVDGGGNDMVLADLESALAAGGKWFVNNNECAILMAFSSWWNLITESSSPIKDASALGAATPLLTGQLGTVYGKRVFASEFVRENVDVAGYYDTGQPNVSTTTLLFNTTRFIRGTRRAVTVEGFRDPFHDLNWLAVRKRSDFQPLDTAASSIEYCRAIINIT